MNKETILIGGFHEIIELCENSNVNIIGIIDNVLKDEYKGYPILGTDNDASMLNAKLRKFPLILTPDQPLNRKRLFDFYSALGYTFTSLISKDAKISKSAIIGCGTIIQAGVNISSSSIVGNFVKLNTYANIMHDSSIGNFTTVAPNAVVLGKVIVQDFCYIGSNSTILPKITIRKLSIVGAGAVVTRDTTESDIVVGIPAKKLEK